MAQRVQRQHGPWIGLHTSVDAENIPDNSAADMRNVTIEDGGIAPRFGFRNFAAPGVIFGWGGSFGFDYVQGYTTAGALVEEYLSFEMVAGLIVPFTIDPVTGTRTPLSNGFASVNLTPPTYGTQPGLRALALNSFAYCISPNEATTPLFRHDIGTVTSFTALLPAQAPAAPKLVIYPQAADNLIANFPPLMKWDDGHTLDVSAVTFGGADAGQLSYYHDTLGGTLYSEDGFLLLHHSLDYGGPFEEKITVDLGGTHGPGVQDFTNIDRFVMSVNSTSSDSNYQLTLDAQSIEVYLINSAGDQFQCIINAVGGTSQGGNTHYSVICDIPVKVSRSQFASIRKIQINWKTSIQQFFNDSPAPQIIQISPLYLGQVNDTPQDSSGNDTDLVLGYTYYSSTTSQESAVSPSVSASPAQLKGILSHDPVNGNITYPLWARPKLYLVKDPSFVANSTTGYRIYARRKSDTVWYRIGDVAFGNVAAGGGGLTVAGVTYDASFNVFSTWSETVNSPSSSLGGNPWKGLVCACAFKGWMVWGFQGGRANIRHSMAGTPEVTYNSADSTQLDPGNTAAPANYTLADNSADDPVAIFAVGDSLVILGSHGVYAQSGFAPNAMSPTKRLPTALGCLGQYAACSWHDEVGNPAVVFVSRNAEGIYMVQNDPSYWNETREKVTELTEAIRGTLKAFLLDGQGLTSWSGLRMGVDETKQALYVIMGSRAMVLRRPSLVDGKRHWELYDYGVTIAGIAFSTQRRLRWIRSTGHVDDVEWNSATNSYISGANSDAGNPPTGGIFFVTKKFTGDNRRLDLVYVDRVSLTDTPTITAISNRQTRAITVASGHRHFRFGFKQQGWEHQLRLDLADGSGAIRRIVVDELTPEGERVLG